jgi:ABC-type uncharacterized transport system permease subunit
MKNVSANFENVVFDFFKKKSWSLGNVGQFLMKNVDLIFLNKMFTTFKKMDKGWGITTSNLVNFCGLEVSTTYYPAFAANLNKHYWVVRPGLDTYLFEINPGAIDLQDHKSFDEHYVDIMSWTHSAITILLESR